MRVRRSRNAVASTIPTATMADIAFLVIIFFMVTTAYSVDRSPLALPETREQQELPRGAAVISIDPAGVVRFSDGSGEAEPVGGIADLAARIRSVASANRLRPFAIRADRDTSYRAIDGVLDELRQAGAENVVLLTKPERRP